MAEARAKGEGETRNERTPPPPPSPNPNPNPRKRNNLKYLVPTLYNCHSCDRHVPPRRQTLASLYPLDSEWRVVHLCDQCLCLIKSAVKCSYCFADFPAASSTAGNARAGSTSIASLPSSGLPESFVCVDCCALPMFGNKKPRSFFAGVSVDELAEVAAKALEKVRDAKRAMERAREALGAVSVRTIDQADLAVRDDE